MRKVRSCRRSTIRCGRAVIFFSSRTGKYLEASPGAPTRQVFNLARRGLRLDMRAAFREAVESGRPAVRERVEVEDEEGRVQILTLRIEPLPEASAEEPLFIVL